MGKAFRIPSTSGRHQKSCYKKEKRVQFIGKELGMALPVLSGKEHFPAVPELQEARCNRSLQTPA